MSSEEKIKRLEELRAAALLGGGEARIERQHKAGKLTARERLAAFFDPGTFVEIDKFVVHRCSDFGMQDQKILGDGLVTGHGKVNGRQVFVYAMDFTVFGGALSGAFAEKMCKVMDLAERTGAPIVGLNDGAGARIQEGVVSLGGYGDVFYRNVKVSGVIPQFSAILGPCAGGSVYSPVMTDFVIMVKNTSNMFITGPDVVRSVTHQEVTTEELGGAMVHATKSGLADFAVDNDEQCLELMRDLMSYIPQNNLEDPPFVATRDPAERMAPELARIVPDAPNQPYDMKELIHHVVDDGRFLEVGALYGRNLVVGFARLGGRSVGIVANQPAHLAGVLDIDCSKKGARFVRFCDAFNIPIITLADTPGFLPGVQQEHNGIIIHGSKLLYAFCEATVPRITVITRKCIGGAYLVMGSKHVGGDLNYAYPGAEIAVMGADGAANIVFRKEIKAAEDSDAKREELVAGYREKFANPYKAAELGYIDDVIKAEETRPTLIRGLELLQTKRVDTPRRKHGNIPL